MYPRKQRMNRDQDEEKRILKQGPSSEAASGPDLAQLEDARAAIAVREEELTSRMYELDAKEARLDAAPAANGAGPVVAAQWAALAAERQVLAGRWMCLAEDKKAVAVLERRLREGDDPAPEPFEPGSLPIQDVRCAIIAHQVDVPCSSCCFQR